MTVYFRRNKQSRSSLSKSSGKCLSGSNAGGARRSRGPRRPVPRAPRAPRTPRPCRSARAPAHALPPPRAHPLSRWLSHSRLSAPSSERTDSDEPAHCLFRSSGRVSLSCETFFKCLQHFFSEQIKKKISKKFDFKD